MSRSKLTRFLEFGIAAILLLVPFQALLTTWLGSNFGHLDLFRIWKELLLVPLALASLSLVYRDKRLKEWFTNSPIVLLIGLYVILQLGLGLYAFKASKVNGSALIYGLLINLRFLVFFLVCVIIASQSEWLTKNWQKLILWPATIVVIFGLLQHFILPTNFLSHFGYGPKTIPAYQAVDQKPDFIRAQSTLRGPNPLGAYLVVVIICATAYFISRKKQRWARAALIVGASIVLYFTYSRSAWLGTFVGLVLLAYTLIKKKQTRYWILLGCACVTLVLATVVAVWNKNTVVENTLFHTSQTSQSPESSNAVRTKAMLNGAKSVLRQPLGRGPGTAGPASVRNNHPARIAENYFIQIGQEAGLLGLSLFIAINLFLAKELWRNKQNQLAVITLAALIGLTIVNCLSHSWADDTLAYVFWGLAGLALAPSVILSPSKQRKTNHAKA